MLKIGLKEKQILDGLLDSSPKQLALELGIPVKRIYATKNYFLRKVQNAEEFLAVARGKYSELLSRRLKTPKIMPIEKEE